jgi:hypothetical protein
MEQHFQKNAVFWDLHGTTSQKTVFFSQHRENLKSYNTSRIWK